MSLSGFAPVANPFSLETFLASPLSCGTDMNWEEQEAGGVPLLSACGSALPGPLFLAGACTSTLDIARELCRRELFPEWASVLALKQSAGRGQMRRTWSSPEGNLYAALRLPVEGPFAFTAAAPAIGALCAEGLSSEGFPVLLKWPNDICRRTDEGAMLKAGGILLEESGGALVAGIGLNIASCPPPSQIRPGAAAPAGTLAGGRIVSIFTLWLRLAARIFSCYEKLKEQDAWWVRLAESRMAYLGCPAIIEGSLAESGSDPLDARGIVAGISRSGALLLKTQGGAAAFLGGSLLPLRDTNHPRSE